LICLFALVLFQRDRRSRAHPPKNAYASTVRTTLTRPSRRAPAYLFLLF
jgi:hypothetical protein